MLHITAYADVNDFYQHAGPFLEAHEAEHCLMVGTCMLLRQQITYSDIPPHFWIAGEADQIIGAAMWTPPYNFVLSLGHTPASLDMLARTIAPTMPDLPGVLGPSETSRAFAEIWQALTGRQMRAGIKERVFRLTQVNPVSGVPGRLRRATEADRDLLLVWLADFEREALSNMVTAANVAQRVDRYLSFAPTGMYLWDNGAPVACAGFTGPTPHGMRVGPVYTPPELRRRGYASACVAGLSQHLLNEGRTYCFLFTDLANPTSNHIYQQIGYAPVGDVDEYRFA